MKFWALVLGLARARVDIGRIGANNAPSAYQPECPPQDWIDLFRQKIIIFIQTSFKKYLNVP